MLGSPNSAPVSLFVATFGQKGGKLPVLDGVFGMSLLMALWVMAFDAD